ncbi:MAG: xylulokinase [Pseudomonadota bacterium]
MYIGIDLGTSGVKVVLVDGDQQIVASHTAPLKASYPQSGWAEQNAEDWLTATNAAMEGLAATNPNEMGAVRGIGLSGQQHGATFVADDDSALRPCMLWNDTRSHVQAARMDSDPKFRDRIGNIVFPGFTAPKVQWVREHEPDVFERTRMVLLPKDFLRLWLTGEAVSDMSDASGTGWLNVAKRDWEEELLADTGLSLDHMPRLVEGSEASGQLRDALAGGWGLPKGVIVAGGGGDNAASAVGQGIVAPGSAFVSLGTSGVLFAVNDSYKPNAASAVHTFCHALPDTWHQMGVILSAAGSMDWLSGVLNQSASDLSDEASALPNVPSTVHFLPYLSGERTPHNDAAIRGAFVGLGVEHGAADMARAVMEGVAFAFRDNLEALKQAGTDLDRVVAVGGGSKSPLWLEIMAASLDLPVDLPGDGDYGGAFGAARLGRLAAGGEALSDIATPPPIVRTVEPDADMAKAYGQAYERWKPLYSAVSSVTAQS